MADVPYSGSMLSMPAGAEFIIDNISKTLNHAGGVANALKGISICGTTSVYGDSPHGRHLTPYMTKSVVEGNPEAPSLELKSGFWRFRWVVRSGSRSISVDTKQDTFSGCCRPMMIVKSNPEIGINTDLSSSAITGSGWFTIGPIAVTAVSTGVTWVELRNEDTGSFLNPAYFDHISVT